MPDFLTDEEMAKLETEPVTKEVISDEQMAEMEAASKPGYIESGARGFTKGATMGFSDELSGALGAGMELVTGKSGLKDVADNYRYYRDTFREQDDAAKAANPTTFGAGEIGGAVAGAGKIGALSKGAKGLAALGGVTGLGGSDADLTKGQIGGALKDTAVGTATGLATAGVAKGLQGVASKAGNKLGSVAEFIANKLKPAEPQVDKLIFDPASKILTKAPAVASSPQWGETIAKKVGDVATNSAIDMLPGGALVKTGVRAAAKLVPDSFSGQMKSGLQKVLEQAPQKLGKYASILQNAKARGGAAYATTTFLLGQSDPEFQQLTKDLED